MHDLLQRDARAIADINRIRFAPATAMRGEGCWLIDADGRRVLDLSSSWGAASLGYGHPAVTEAVATAAHNMAGAGLLSIVNEPAVALAERLLEGFPDGEDRRVWIGHSGSDTNDVAVRLCEAVTGRKRFIAFVGAYHGGSAASQSVSGHVSHLKDPQRPGLLRLPFLDRYRPDTNGDIAGAVLDRLDEHFATDFPPDKVAGIFFETIQSDSGMHVPPAGFLQEIEARCRMHGILTVADEVKTGIARTGSLYAFQQEGLLPDLVGIGKGLGGGLPLSAVVGRQEIMDHAPAFAILTTSGNPVCTAAGGAVLQTIADNNLAANAHNMGNRLMAGLRQLATRHELIGDVRGRGLLIGVDLVTDRESKAPAAMAAAKVAFHAWQLGVNLFVCGMHAMFSS